MNEAVARKVLLSAFHDELEKLSWASTARKEKKAAAQHIEKWASATFPDWNELSDLEKQAFIGKMVQSVGKAFGMGKPAAGKAVMQKAKPLVEFGDKPLTGAAALRSQKHMSGVGDITYK